MPSIDHLQAFLEGKAHGVRIVEGPYPMSRADDWPGLRVQKFMPSDTADVATDEAL